MGFSLIKSLVLHTLEKDKEGEKRTAEIKDKGSAVREREREKHSSCFDTESDNL